MKTHRLARLSLLWIACVAALVVCAGADKDGFTDTFDVPRCNTELAAFSDTGVETIVNCMNEKPDTACDLAYEECMCDHTGNHCP